MQEVKWLKIRPAVEDYLFSNANKEDVTASHAAQLLSRSRKIKKNYNLYEENVQEKVVNADTK